MRTGAEAHARQWELSAYLAAIGVALLLGTALWKLPIQLSDSFTEFIGLQGQTVAQVVRTEVSGAPYFRPLRRGLIKVLIDVSNGNYFPWFRGFQILEVLLLFLLFARMMRPRTATGAAVMPLAFAMIAGSHVFADILREAFPVNHFLTIAICAVASVTLAQSRGGWLVDAAAVLLLAFAMMTIESGLLIWVILVTAYVVGYRGVSAAGIVAVTVVFVSYFVLRFGVFGGTMPAIGERDSGFLLSAATGGDLRRQFGSSPWIFYAYNFVSALSCLLFAEPRGGTFVLIGSVVAADVRPWQILTVATSTLTTAIIAWHVATRARTWRPFRIDGNDRLVALFLVLLPANAMFDIVYEKDVVLSVAGIFYVAAAVVAIQRLLQWLSGASGIRTVLASAAVVVIACGWSMRYIGAQYRLREVAAVHRDDWAYYDQWQRKQATVELRTPAEKRVWQTLYDDAIWKRPAPPSIESRFLDAWSDPTQ